MSKEEGVDMIGLNCSACHVGQVQYQGRAVRIDGLGNMVVVNNFLGDIVEETKKTAASPQRLDRLWKRFHDVQDQRRARGGKTDLLRKDERTVQRVIDIFTKNRGLVEAQLKTILGLSPLLRSINVGTDPGYGRLDAFGIGRDELFGPAAGTGGVDYSPPSAPVSLPHIWGMQYTAWLQWGANTNSVMERNIG
jgi:hypothetical protein